MKRWIFILAITFSVVQMSDGIFGKSKKWTPSDPFGDPSWMYARLGGESPEYDMTTTTLNPFTDHNPKRKPRRIPKVGLTCLCGSSSSESDTQNGRDRGKHKHKHKPKKKPHHKKNKKHKKHSEGKNDGFWAPRPPLGLEYPSVNEIWE